MKEDNFKEMLVAALQEPEIQEQVRKFVFQGNPDRDLPATDQAEIKDLKNRVLELKAALEQSKSERNRENAENTRLRQENQRLAEAKNEVEQRYAIQQTELQHWEKSLKQYRELMEKQDAELKSIQNEVKSYRVFAEAVTLFREYNSLPSEVILGSANIIRSESADLFLATGCQKENILALWDFMKSEWDGLDEPEKNVFMKMLAYFLKMINQQYQRPLFRLMDCKVGDRFDDRLHIRTADSSRYSGAIRQICIPGILNVYNGETVVRKSLVVV